MTLLFHKTCDACPEQYDAYQGQDRVGYLRLRHGFFTVVCPDVGGALVYEATPKGDGEFFDDERDYYMRFAAEAILRWIANRRPLELPPAPAVEYQFGNPPALKDDDHDHDEDQANQ